MKYTSVSAMPSKKWFVKSKKAFVFMVSLIMFLFLLSNHLTATVMVIDRVVASVDDDAITLREFELYYQSLRAITPDVTKTEALETLINRHLILRDARRMNIVMQDDDETIQRYISVKVRSFVKIGREDVRRYYNENRDRFEGVGLDAVYDRIEKLLLETEVNRRLRRHLEELRNSAYIKINLKEP